MTSSSPTALASSLENTWVIITQCSAPYGDHWPNLRRITALEIFSSTRLQLFSNIRINEVRYLLRRLAGTGESYKTVYMKSMFFELTLNMMMMMMIAGKRYYGEKVMDLEEARQFIEIVKETFAVSGVSNVGDFLSVLRWVGGFKGLEKRAVDLQGKRTKFILNQRRRRRRRL